MKTRSFVLFLALSVFSLGAGPTLAGGFTAGQLANAGFECFPAGASDWIHCLDVNKLASGRQTVAVKVFSADGAEFLGTELLLHGDIYAGQPCPQDELDLWAPLDGTPYVACHHFPTGGDH